MITPVYTRQFERDLNRMRKRGKYLDKLKIIVRTLLAETILDPIYHDHKLTPKLHKKHDKVA